MRVMKTIILTLLLSALAQIAAGEMLNGVDIKKMPSFDDNNITGYYECEYMLVNHDSTVKTVKFNFESSGGYQMCLGEMNQTVTVPPLASIRTRMYVPGITFQSPQLNLFVNGQYFPGNEYGLGIKGMYSYYRYRGNSNILVSQTVPGNVGSFTANISSSGYKTTYCQATIPVSEWSSNWLAYSNFSAVMISDADMNKMPGAVASALDQFVRLGGVMVVVGGNPAKNAKKIVLEVKEEKEDESSPDPFAKARAARAAVSRRGVSVPPPPPAPSVKPKSKPKIQHIYEAECGFGKILYFQDTPEKWTDEQWKSMLKDAEDKTGSKSYSNDRFPVMENVKVPVRQLFLMMLVFVIIIGPVSMIVLGRKKKMIWILWTTPLLSCIFAVMVIAYSFFSEGWHSRVRVSSMTLLDENAELASSLGLLGYYCPIAPRGGLHFSAQTELNDCNENNSRSVGIDWTSGQHLTFGWIQSRVPTFLMLRQSESRKERLKICGEFTADGVEVMNGLGAKIVELQLFGPNNILYKSERSIEAGAKTRLIKSDGNLPEKESKCILRHIFTDDWVNSLQNVTHIIKTLSPGTYCARLSHSPFVSPGMKPGELKEQCMVVGKLRGQEGEK